MSVIAQVIPGEDLMWLTWLLNRLFTLHVYYLMTGSIGSYCLLFLDEDTVAHFTHLFNQDYIMIWDLEPETFDQDRLDEAPILMV